MGTWQLQTAKAKLSELLRAVREEGPQVISVRGKEEYVVLRKEDVSAHLTPRPRTWDDLFAIADGAGDALVLPPRERDGGRLLELGEDATAYEAED